MWGKCCISSFNVHVTCESPGGLFIAGSDSLGSPNKLPGWMVLLVQGSHFEKQQRKTLGLE